MGDEQPLVSALRTGYSPSGPKTLARIRAPVTVGRCPASLPATPADLVGSAAPEVQWTINECRAVIGIYFPKHRKRAIAIGEELGVYRDYPVSKGCTSPFAPIWINAMVSRQS
jgi:hypothetical protein